MIPFSRCLPRPLLVAALCCCQLLGSILIASSANPSETAVSPPGAYIARDKTPSELFEVVKIVDGDTIHILRDGEKEKLRLLSVDTEEKLTPGQRGSVSKPQTVFGEETRLWTIDYFEQFRGVDGTLSVGLAFPGGHEERDIYGRLLCHVLTSDGTDFNLLLVQLGKSPYFNKYGNSRIDHEGFQRAQAHARRNLIGIWNPRTNLATTEGQPSARRDYGKLLPWWQARADAIEGFRLRSQRAPQRVVAADNAEGLAQALASGKEVSVFGTIDRFFDEEDGSRTVLMRATDKKRALRISIPKEARASFAEFDLDAVRAEFRQNYVYVRGVIVQGKRGFRFETADPQFWSRAGKEPH